jgi:hypothetical protein
MYIIPKFYQLSFLVEKSIEGVTTMVSNGDKKGVKLTVHNANLAVGEEVDFQTVESENGDQVSAVKANKDDAATLKASLRAHFYGKDFDVRVLNATTYRIKRLANLTADADEVYHFSPN